MVFVQQHFTPLHNLSMQFLGCKWGHIFCAKKESPCSMFPSNGMGDLAFLCSSLLDRNPFPRLSSASKSFSKDPLFLSCLPVCLRKMLLLLTRYLGWIGIRQPTTLAIHKGRKKRMTLENTLISLTHVRVRPRK